jgi:hypothetical protein
MQSLQPIFIGPYDKGLKRDKKPFLLPDEAFSTLENAYVYRDRVQKRLGLELLGRLRRVLTTVAMGNISAGGAGTFTFNIFTGMGIAATEPDAEMESGAITNITIAIGAPINQTLTDAAGTGVMTVVGAGPITSALLIYATGDLIITFSGAAGASAATITGAYFPSLPVMGLPTREIDGINNEQMVAFDTKYAYVFVGAAFIEFPSITPTTWAGTDSDFFWATNYRGSTPQSRLFFVTNFVNDAADPMRYYDGTDWITFAPAVGGVSSTGADNSYLFQARILIPYYGRLVALNVWEGANIAASVHIPNRCRFSQIGDPTQPTVVGPPFVGGAWRSDVFGKGGFLDAPVQEDILGARFFKNTLIVRFERSTWQLRYVGEYGLPFIWERISSDFGGESTFSDVLFDSGVLSVGDRAITIASAVNVNRIDEDIPDTVFNFRNAQDGLKRVHGIRDFQRELVFWNYVDAQMPGKFPGKVLVYNYRNSTFAEFRDNVTAWGTYQAQTGVSWDSNVSWDDEGVTWDDVDGQSLFPFVVGGNQQGYVFKYGYKTPEDPTLSITAIDLTTTPIRITVKNHNLEDGNIVYIEGLTFVDSGGSPVATDLNDKFYQVSTLPPADPLSPDTLLLTRWNFTAQAYEQNFSFTPASTATYVGLGQLALYPVLYVATKDFNPMQKKGLQFKLSRIDFMMDATPSAEMSVVLYLNSSQSVIGNLLVGNRNVETYLPSPYYVPQSEYAWHSFYATLAGQYIRVVVTYDDNLMNTMTTHQQIWTLNAMNLWVLPGGRILF